MNWLIVIAFCLAAYLIGAIPFSWLFVKWFRGLDLRTVGSGNLGSTNAMRALGAKLGFTVQALDIVKGWLPVVVFIALAKRGLIDAGANPINPAMAVGLCAVLGHMFPVYLKFRGGKGVNTSLGVFLALAPKSMLLAAAIGIGVMALTRTVSVGSITGSLALPLATWYYYGNNLALVIVTAIVSVLVIYMHRSNIGRLLAGTESRIGQRVKVGEANEQSAER